jgi:hypothetical protein
MSYLCFLGSAQGIKDAFLHMKWGCIDCARFSWWQCAWGAAGGGASIRRPASPAAGRRLQGVVEARAGHRSRSVAQPQAHQDEHRDLAGPLDRRAGAPARGPGATTAGRPALQPATRPGPPVARQVAQPVQTVPGGRLLMGSPPG